jgi:hypothetical protein
MGSSGITSGIFNLGILEMNVVSFTPWPIYSLGYLEKEA